MKSRFQMSSMGELTFFLGLQVKQKEDGIFISQDKYVVEILKKFDFASVKTASTPIETQKPLVKDEEASDVDVHLYRSMIGSLMYLTASRPNIMFAVCACSRFQVTPKTSHLNAVKRIFRYLKGKPKLGLWYPRVSSFDLEAYSDSDYAGERLGQRVKKDDSVKGEIKEEEGTRKRKSGHVKMIARKRPRPQPDADSDDEHRKCLRITTFESTIDSEVMETKSVIARLQRICFIYWDLVMKQYQKITPERLLSMILWGGLKEFDGISTEEKGIKELLQRMLDLGLEVEEESTVALDLIRFIKQQLNEE
ncbi:uncharacterized mitochondrial protein-like protein [Tanacetum coccineum]